jgi:hypothetical protein
MIIEIRKTNAMISVLLTVQDRADEEFNEPGQRILVHWLDICHICTENQVQFINLFAVLAVLLISQIAQGSVNNQSPLIPAPEKNTAFHKEVQQVALLTRNTKEEYCRKFCNCNIGHSSSVNDRLCLLSHSLLFSDFLRESFGRVQHLKPELATLMYRA